MVRATTSLETVRHELTSIEGGWVTLKPMSYGQFLQRRDMAMKMGVSGQSAQRGVPEKLDVELIQAAVTQFEFKVCITDHNLEDENGRKLLLGEPADFQRLDPRIGQEISDLIDDMTQWEDTKRPDGSAEAGREGNTVPEDSEASA